jgi:hypothetical protein
MVNKSDFHAFDTERCPSGCPPTRAGLTREQSRMKEHAWKLTPAARAVTSHQRTRDQRFPHIDTRRRVPVMTVCAQGLRSM